MEYGGLLQLIVIFDDQDTAHTEQCLGVASALSDITGAEIVKFQVPHLRGIRRFISRHSRDNLLSGRWEEIVSWLKHAKGESLIRGVGRLFAEKRLRENSSKVVFISAGSESTTYNLAIAHVWKVACVVLGNPSYIGTKPFEFAVITEYDNAEPESNQIKVVTMPNNIRKELIAQEGLKLKAACRPKSEKIWSVFIDGIRKHNINIDKLRSALCRISNMAEIADADLYISVAADAGKKCIDAIRQTAQKNSAVRYLHVEGEDEYNPRPAMIHLADNVFCTACSSKTVSDIITGGKNVILLRTVRFKGIRHIIDIVVEKLIEHGAVSSKYAGEITQTEIILDRFKRHGKLTEFTDWISNGGKNNKINYNLEDEPAIWQHFNEADRVARWIAESLSE